jgi:hypothetical protein
MRIVSLFTLILGAVLMVAAVVIFLARPELAKPISTLAGGGGNTFDVEIKLRQVARSMFDEFMDMDEGMLRAVGAAPDPCALTDCHDLPPDLVKTLASAAVETRREEEANRFQAANTEIANRNGYIAAFSAGVGFLSFVVSFLTYRRAATRPRRARA